MFKVLESHTFAKSSHTPQNEYVLGKSIDPKLIGFIQSNRVGEISHLVNEIFRPLTPPCVPFGTRRFNQLSK